MRTKWKSAVDKCDHRTGISHPWPQLLDCVFNTNIPATIRRWLYNYMQNRGAKIHFWQQESKSRKVKTGVVQGGVLSPALFNYSLANFPTPPANIKLIKYADDITIYTSGPAVTDLINGPNVYLSQVLKYISNKKLTVSTAKSTVTLFTKDTNEFHLHPQVKLADQVLLLNKKPKVIGVTLDNHLTFTQHCNNIAVEMQQRNNVLKALVGCTCGCDKETLLTPYQAICRLMRSYCCPVWTPSRKDTNWRRLQRAQNLALRIVTESRVTGTTSTPA